MEKVLPEIAIVSQLRIKRPGLLHGKVISECFSFARRMGKCVFICFNELNKFYDVEVKIGNSIVKIYSIPLNMSTKKSFIANVINLIKAQFLLLGRLLYVIKHEKVKIIRSENILLTGLPTLLASKLTKSIYVLWYGGNELKAIRNKFGVSKGFLGKLINILYLALGLLIMPRTELTITVSDELTQMAKKIRAKRIYKTQNFVDLNLFKPLNKERKNVLLYVGRLSREKGVLVLLDAYKKLQREGIANNVKLWIVGDGDLRDEIERIITQNELEENMKMFGLIEHRRLPFIYNEARIFVLPSYTEGSPATLLEAMASGLVVIATAVGEVPNIIIDGETGFLVNKIGDVKALKDAIIKALSLTKEEEDDIRKNARKRVEEISGNYLKNHLLLYHWVYTLNKK